MSTGPLQLELLQLPGVQDAAGNARVAGGRDRDPRHALHAHRRDGGRARQRDGRQRFAGEQLQELLQRLADVAERERGAAHHARAVDEAGAQDDASLGEERPQRLLRVALAAEVARQHKLGQLVVMRGNEGSARDASGSGGLQRADVGVAVHLEHRLVGAKATDSADHAGRAVQHALIALRPQRVAREPGDLVAPGAGGEGRPAGAADAGDVQPRGQRGLADVRADVAVAAKHHQARRPRRAASLSAVGVRGAIVASKGAVPLGPRAHVPQQPARRSEDRRLRAQPSALAGGGRPHNAQHDGRCYCASRRAGDGLAQAGSLPGVREGERE
mmetsp:Transcript_33440/g.83840  ORF Transcript_33440/g.83840 Transcript_33440/m.83840 type:complete len:330 (+) Transcript_33440:887-1876(+)